MTSKRLRFCLICLVLWPASIFIANRLGTSVAATLWWLASKLGATSLSRPVFDTGAWLPLALIDGFVLGWIPILKLRTLVLDVLAAGRFHPSSPSEAELNPTRPILWAWVLPTACFALRFAIWGIHAEHSVLTGVLVNPEPGRLAHFFGPLDTLTASTGFASWLDDRMFLTSPMLFSGSYALAVWLRHRLPTLGPSFPQHPGNEAADTLGS